VGQQLLALRYALTSAECVGPKPPGYTSYCMKVPFLKQQREALNAFLVPSPWQADIALLLSDQLLCL